MGELDMIKQFMPWILISLTATTACMDDKADDEDTGSSEVEDTSPPPPVVTGLTIDRMGFYTWLGYVGGSPVSDADDNPHVTISDVESSRFSIYLLDSTKQDACFVNWSFTNADLTEDAELLSGTVADAFDTGVTNVSTWGYTIAGVTPTTTGTCDDWEDDASQQIYDALMNQETPGFGFGPLTSDVESGIETNNSDAETAKNYAITGFMSLTILSEGAVRKYYDLNEAYVYPIDTDGLPSWNPQGESYPQGTELTNDAVEFADAFYYSQPVMEIGWGQ
jgi:hypothetical protein